MLGMSILLQHNTQKSKEKHRLGRRQKRNHDIITFIVLSHEILSTK